jgi:hypothetical protein
VREKIKCDRHGKRQQDMREYDNWGCKSHEKSPSFKAKSITLLFKYYPISSQFLPRKEREKTCESWVVEK